MRKILLLALALALLSTAASAESTRMFSGRGLGFDLMIDDEWYGKDESQYVAFWRRTDEEIAVDGLYGYGIVYVIPDYSLIPSLGTRDETEDWLNENCVAVGGIITHAEGFDAADIYPDFERREMTPAGSTHFTLIRPSSINVEGLEENVAAIATRVYEGLDDDARYVTSDLSVDYGYLGQFSTYTLAGDAIDNSYISQSDLTIVYFWATYCNPCISTMKQFSDVVEQYADQNVRALGVVIDVFPDDDRKREEAREIIASTGVTFENIPMALSSETLMKIQSTPSYVFLDKDGHQLGSTVVGAQSAQGYAMLIESYLG
ncbi:MAG: TlpA disulfide reductase family protein [Clostridia bacterium]|nr:TlpA disulfide reductase family protein [Clostridia bacterium]